MFFPLTAWLRVHPALIAAVLVAVAAPTRAADDVRIISDMPYLGEDRTEKLDLYLPPDSASGPNSAKLRPAVVYFHGGGWVRGDKATEREQNIGSGLARAGYVFVRPFR